MSAKELKSTLKLAKDCIDKKDFTNAMKHCKTVLKEDRNNYVALVLLGACIQEGDQPQEASKAFKKAIQISPEQPLAWKGLALFYEKQNKESDREDLLSAYTHLLILETDCSRHGEWLRKIGILLSLLGPQSILKFWNDVTNFNKMEIILDMLAYTLATNDFEQDNSLLPLYETILREKTCQDQTIISIYKKYLNIEYKLGNMEKVLTRSKEMSELFPKIISGPEWFCRSFIELKSQNYDNLPNPQPIYKVLFELCPNSHLSMACKGIDLMANHDYLNAIDDLTQSVLLKPTYGLAWYFVVECEMTLHRFEDAEKSIRKAISLNGSRKDLIERLRFCLVVCGSETNDQFLLVEALNIGEDLFWGRDSNDVLTLALAKIALKLGHDEKYKKFIDSLVKKELKYLIWSPTGDINERLNILEGLNKELVDYFEFWLQLGSICYELKDTTNALTCLLKAVKLNQWYYMLFFYLGNCYKNLLNDLTKARRCYHKAFQLNPRHSDSGICLSDIYRIQGMQEENMTLLKIAQKVPGARWPFLKLGLHYLSINKPIDAVSSLRVAVRQNSADLNVWESLADAYLAQGSYTAALKSYQKVLELKPTSMYPLLQIATVKCRQGFYEESVLEFREVLKLDPNFMPALKGHAESCLLLMNEKLKLNLNGLARDVCQEAVTSLTKILEKRRDIICVWKLLGDALRLTSNLPIKYCKIRVPFWLWQNRESKHIEYVELLHKDILLLGVRCFCQAIALHPNSSELWYDLAFCYNSVANIADTPDEAKSSRDFALSATTKSIFLKNDDLKAWNLLGIIFASKEINNNPKAQHAFIQALKLDENQATAWANLGNLYLKLGDLLLANQAFGEAQRCDPDFSQSWIGQGMVAEATGHTEEAMDLYRHSTQLKFHPQGALGYSNLVCHTLLTTKDKSDPNYIYSIKNMDAVSVAHDLMIWYTELYPSDPCALNMLGILRERLHLYRTSLTSFESALQVVNSSDDSPASVTDQVLLNLGRLQVRNKLITEGLATLSAIKTATFENQCVLASAYLEAERYENAYETYNSALEWLAPDDENKSHILVAMSAVLYPHQGADDTKILLMQACQLKPISVAGLFSCCALGLLHNDPALSMLTLNELTAYQNDPTYLTHVTLFRSYAQLLEGNENDALRVVAKAIHVHPANAKLRLFINKLLLIIKAGNKTGNLKVNFSKAMRCGYLGSTSGRSACDISKMLCLIGLSRVLSNEIVTGLRTVTKAMHLYPNGADNWIVFIATTFSYFINYHNEKSMTSRLEWLKRSINHVRNNMPAPKDLRSWLDNHEKRIDLLIDAL